MHRRRYLPTRRARRSAPNTITIEGVTLNPAETAIVLCSTPPPFDDRFALDADGVPIGQSGPLLQEHAIHQVAVSVYERVLAHAEETELAELSATARELAQARIEAAKRRQVVEAQYDKAIAAYRLACEYVGYRRVSPSCAFFGSWGGKGLTIVADTALIAVDILPFSPSTELALLAALGLATGLTTGGAKLGLEAGRHYDRLRRGPAPADTPKSLRGLYDDGDAWTGVAAWGRGVFALAALVVIALSVAGMGSHVGAQKAIGAAMLVGLSVLASAAAQALGTDVAAEERDHAEDASAALGDEVADFEEVASEAEAAQARLEAKADAARHTAYSAYTQVIAMGVHGLAMRPEIAGYLATDGLPTVSQPEQPNGLAVETGPAATGPVGVVPEPPEADDEAAA